MISKLPSNITAAEIIAELNMQPHPEGGHFVETFRDGNSDAGRAYSTAIYYLLGAGERSHWHKVDAVEVWHYHAGAPLDLSIAEDGAAETLIRLGPAILTGERPQGIVPRGHWQAARSTGAWTLVGCTVAPGFEFGGFEMAPAGWSP